MLLSCDQAEGVAVAKSMAAATVPPSDMDFATMLYLNPELPAFSNITTIENALSSYDASIAALAYRLPPIPAKFDARVYLAAQPDVSGLNACIRAAMIAEGASSGAVERGGTFVATLMQEVSPVSGGSRMRVLDSGFSLSESNLRPGDEVKLTQPSGMALYGRVAAVHDSSTFTLCNVPAMALSSANAAHFTLFGIKVFDAERQARVSYARNVAAGVETPPEDSGVAADFNQDMYSTLYPDARTYSAPNAYIDYRLRWKRQSEFRLASAQDIMHMRSPVSSNLINAAQRADNLYVTGVVTAGDGNLNVSAENVAIVSGVSVGGAVTAPIAVIGSNFRADTMHVNIASSLTAGGSNLTVTADGVDLAMGVLYAVAGVEDVGSLLAGTGRGSVANLVIGPKNARFAAPLEAAGGVSITAGGLSVTSGDVALGAGVSLVGARGNLYADGATGEVWAGGSNVVVTPDNVAIESGITAATSNLELTTDAMVTRGSFFAADCNLAVLADRVAVGYASGGGVVLAARHIADVSAELLPDNPGVNLLIGPSNARFGRHVEMVAGLTLASSDLALHGTGVLRAAAGNFTADGVTGNVLIGGANMLVTPTTMTLESGMLAASGNLDLTPYALSIRGSFYAASCNLSVTPDAVVIQGAISAASGCFVAHDTGVRIDAPLDVGEGALTVQGSAVDVSGVLTAAAGNFTADSVSGTVLLGGSNLVVAPTSVRLESGIVAASSNLELTPESLTLRGSMYAASCNLAVTPDAVNVRGTLSAAAGGLIADDKGVWIVAPLDVGAGAMTVEGAGTASKVSVGGGADISGVFTAAACNLVVDPLIARVAGDAEVGGFMGVGPGMDIDAVAMTGATLAVSGDVFTTGTVVTQSDVRAKTDLRPIEGALSIVSRLRGMTFEALADGRRRRHTGLVAQDVQSVLPEAVYSGANGMYSIAYGNLAGLLVEAIKELFKRIEDIHPMSSEHS